MGVQKEKSRQSFGPQDLGILDRPSPRGLRALVELCAVSVQAPIAALFIFDETASELFLNNSVGLPLDAYGESGLPLTGSVAAHVRNESRVVRISDLRKPPFDTSAEYLRFGTRAYIGGVVKGPADEPIGVLAAMHPTACDWTFHQAKLVGDMAYLLSQQIMLKASFETLRLMSAERRKGYS